MDIDSKSSMQQQAKGDDAVTEHDEGGTIEALDVTPSYGPEGVGGLISSGYVFGAACLASLGGFSFGYDQGVISIINVMPQFHGAIPQTETEFGKGFMTGMLLLGAFVGCIFMPYLADKISRKWALTVVVVIFDISAIIQTAAQNYGMLVAGRAIGGIGVGTLAMVCIDILNHNAPDGDSLLTDMVIQGRTAVYLGNFTAKPARNPSGAGIHLRRFRCRHCVLDNIRDEVD